MSGENVKNFTEQGGARTVIGGELRITTGGKIVPNSGVQATAIVDVTGGSTVDAEARTAINAVLAALRGAGIIGAS